ncbi:MAG: cation:proton antiporter [Wolbachia endosymbiont of Meromenopon meropis]|nr:cation:proton antiporter [Wolbachia endosymbiont of Meromenopon meropis]
MRSYKFLMLFLLSILAIIILKLPRYLDAGLNLSYPVINFDLSLRLILISFLSAALLIILSAKNLSFSEMLFFSTYTISSLCAVLSKQILLSVIFCELMTISASFIIATSSKNTVLPAVKYACIHFFAEIVLTLGLTIDNSNLIIISQLINCACFPFSFWIIDTYPTTSLHGASYLSIFTTKISFLVSLLHTYNLWQNYAEILAFLGTITTIYSIIFASLEQNIRRFLAYNVVGQMGMLILTGSLLSRLENSFPLLVLNIIFSITHQLLFVIIANAIILQTKAVNFNGTKKKLSAEGICTLIAILTMAAFPGTVGFISKSCIVAEIKMNSDNLKLYENLYKILHLLLYLSIGLKFLYYIFITKSKSKSYTKKDSNISMIILTFICIILGNPYLPIYNESVIFNLVYNTQNIWSQFNLLVCTTLLFIPLRKLFLPRINFKVDIDWFFTSLLLYFASLFNKIVLIIKKNFTNAFQNLTKLLINSYFNDNLKFKKVLNYNSVSFVSASSLFLMSVLLVLLCLNH